MTSAAPHATSRPFRLTVGSLVLRDFEAGDADGVHAIVGDDRVTYWMSFESQSRDEAQAMLDGILERQRETPRGEFYLAITESDSPEVIIGFVRLGLMGVKAADLGYALRPEWQGRGIARVAVSRMIEFGIEDLGLHRITANVGSMNTSSMRLVESLGFQREGTIRDHVHTNGAWRDSVSFSLLEGERSPASD
ncbi:GNAT family protein [Nocardioides sp.]|uniref:GNAT family N-acetyltransferase n=1 Tax=Nocardioides sp. TaxID=35761 RepID=UPI0019C1454E|nr:GNAT family protein [Nocardioides sp.]MBC7277725.1 GNAT family N-acetyltransferase [Nocardioides sp.]